ncbi:suppressor of fused domain protein [Corynebacterium hansenii]|uniref:Suppressor of fused domain protein n=1 Tax=Corynebacterium hansenii TaxID=394964 RepID=A0ABV7ZL43_9CORY|nr:suppressor of fused domain protein [Corynebacterium hansenii]WJY99358.1 Suppressor of fused protein (SUFU) [Corynebacterium hansenii]
MFNFFKSKSRIDHDFVDNVPPHLDKYIPGEPYVLQEIVSGDIRLDLFVWEPTEERNVMTLATVGASAYRMKMPHKSMPDRCELIMTLPADWPRLDEIQAMPDDESERWFWPIANLKQAARVPYEMDTFFCIGHTIQAGEDPGETYPGTGFNSMLLGPVISLPEDDYAVQELEADDATCFFYALYPLYPSELEFKMEHGADALFDLFEEHGVTEGVHLDRPPVM